MSNESPYKVHCFICNRGGSCIVRNAEKLFQEVKQEFREKHPKSELRINQSACLGQCERGINAVIFEKGKEPEWHFELNEASAPQLISIIESKIVDKKT